LRYAYIFQWNLRSEKICFSNRLSRIGNDQQPRDKLDSINFDVYEFGALRKVHNHPNSNVPVRPLTAVHKHTWKVKVWNNKDNSFKWSGNQYFTTDYFLTMIGKMRNWIRISNHFFGFASGSSFVHGKMDAIIPK